MRRITIGLGLSAGLTLALAVPAQGQTLVVTKFDDPAPLFCVPGIDCSLREAVTSANGTSEPDTIVLAARTYTLTLDALDTITTDITIQGQGTAATVITGADGAAIPGATTAAYTTTAADHGTAVQCQVTATNAAGTVVATSVALLLPTPAPPAPAPAPPTNTARPTFGGPLRTGLKTTCTAGTWSGATGFAFAWLRNGTTIAGAATAAYTLQAADAGKALQCRVTASGAGGSTVAESAPAVPAKACIVPTLVGATLATARTRLTRANCAVGRITRKLSANAPGRVLASSPAKGKNLAAGAKVALTLSKR